MNAHAAASRLWRWKSRLARNPVLYGAYAVFTRRLLPESALVRIPFGPARGMRWRLRRGDAPWMALGVYEPAVSACLERILRPADVFFDVGAHAGYFSLVASRCVGPTGRVVAFEPAPANAERILEHVELNGLEGVVRVERAAVCDGPGTATFVLTDRDANCHLARWGADSARRRPGDRLEVACTTLDAAVRTHGTPRCVKVDVEGAELAVLQGAVGLLSARDDVHWLVSCHGVELQRQVEARLKQSGLLVRPVEGFEHMLHACRD
ncbi:MAG: FkbM family methyltransferase [Myxococcota bacterium]|nr:FkbM family methyltransferase [Myxococcota bacterium]MDW8362937.1 FkbM family methyltransferase [Myxococcales bacterium]